MSLQFKKNKDKWCKNGGFMKKIWFSDWRCFRWNSKPASYLINLHFQKQSFILKTYKNRAMFLKMQKFASGNSLRISPNCFINSCNSIFKEFLQIRDCFCLSSMQYQVSLFVYIFKLVYKNDKTKKTKYTLICFNKKSWVGYE